MHADRFNRPQPQGLGIAARLVGPNAPLNPAVIQLSRNTRAFAAAQAAQEAEALYEYDRATKVYLSLADGKRFKVDPKTGMLAELGDKGGKKKGGEQRQRPTKKEVRRVGEGRDTLSHGRKTMADLSAQLRQLVDGQHALKGLVEPDGVLLELDGVELALPKPDDPLDPYELDRTTGLWYNRLTDCFASDAGLLYAYDPQADILVQVDALGRRVPDGWSLKWKIRRRRTIC